jgi:phosphatidate cytidylyltransferase
VTAASEAAELGGARPAGERGARPRRGASDLRARVLAAIPAAAFCIFIVERGGLIFALGVGLLGLVCLHELFTMYARVRPVRLAAFLGLIGLVLAAALGGERQVLLAAVACFPVLFVLALAMPVREGGPSLTASMSITVLGIFWIGLAVAHAVLLRDLPHGGGLLVAVLLGTFIGDTGAYLGGRLLGSRRLAPRISPNKTWEGLAIGFVVAVFVVWWYGLGSEWMGGQRGVLLGITVAIAAPLGDLFESKVKRDAGTKDAGSLFGPHGGALDRLDAALFSLVAAYYVWLALA